MTVDLATVLASGDYLRRSGAALVGDKGPAVIAITSANVDYTLALADAGKLITVNSSSVRTITVPTNTAVAFATGTVIRVAAVGTGRPFIVGEDDTVTINGGAGVQLRARYSQARLTKYGTNTWLLDGDVAISGAIAGTEADDASTITGTAT